MKISYDPEVDALCIVFREATVTTKPLGEGITVEHDRDGRLVGIEVLDAVKRFGDAESLHQVIVEGIVNGVGLITVSMGEVLKYLQTGRGQYYAVVIFAAVVGISWIGYILPSH